MAACPEKSVPVDSTWRTHAIPHAPASDLLPGPGPTLRRVLCPDPRPDRAGGGARLGVLLVHRAPLRAVRRTGAESCRLLGRGGGSYLEDSSGVGGIDPAPASPHPNRRGLRDGRRA